MEDVELSPSVQASSSSELEDLVVVGTAALEGMLVAVGLEDSVTE